MRVGIDQARHQQAPRQRDGGTPRMRGAGLGQRRDLREASVLHRNGHALGGAVGQHQPLGCKQQRLPSRGIAADRV